MTIYAYEPVIQARHLHDYVIEFTFGDGLKREIDMAQFFEGPIFEPLRPRPISRNSRCAGAQSPWPNGADIALETLYHDLGPVPRETP